MEIDSGSCIDGPRNGKALEPVALAVIGGHICLCGVKLVEDNRLPAPFEDSEETMHIMVHPDQAWSHDRGSGSAGKRRRSREHRRKPIACRCF
ncbi:hypothetical protein ACFIOY_18250 [Bradyrhizobium sp. TZ2]